MSISYNNDDEVNIAEDDEYVYLDSCASKRLLILRDQSRLESFVYSGGSIQTTRAGVHLNCLGTGKIRDWLDIRVCNDAIKNNCLAGLLRDIGYGLQLLHVPRVVRLCDHKEVIVVCRKWGCLGYCIYRISVETVFAWHMRYCCLIRLLATHWNCYIIVVVISVSRNCWRHIVICYLLE